MYTIGKVSEIVGVTSYTLRYYEKEGLLPNIRRNEKGIRMYGEDDIMWIELIRCLKDTGMAISDIRYIVELSLQGNATIPERKNILKIHREKLEQQMREIDISINKINKKLEWYNGKTREC